ncbi:MAG: SpoIIE family protein phosphatase [Planctomycetota bacterium]|jgi:serine phosphatase RsbU (regulator of sigma subunit)/pSer/pThr/pTyr-binding forkhead associated (FHA) protein
MAVLRVLKGLSPGQLFPLDTESIVLGRHPECDVVLDVGAVSRQHARIVRLGENHFIEDLNSRNGTFLNGNPLAGRQPLSENDQVRICDIEFVFHHGSPDSPIPVRSQEDTVEGAMLVEDEKLNSSSTIMSKVDISSGSSALRLTVNAETKLKALMEIGQNLGRAVALGEVLPKVLDSLFAVFLQADRGFIGLKDLATGRLVPKAIKHRREATSDQIRISRTIVSGVMTSREAVLSADAATDSRFDMAESIVDFQIHSMMCAPLVGKDGEALGVIQIDTMDQRQRFTQDDLEVLASVACQAAVAVENAQLHEIAVEEAALRRELTVAHRVQQGFLPPGPPEIDAYEFFDFYEPAQELGGDYFDYIHLPGGRLAVALADVSGKGIAAALLMAKLSTEVRYSLVREPTLASAVCRLNQVFCESRWEDRFVTLVVAVLDPARHEACVANAGHLPPLMRQASGAVESIGRVASGLPLGIDGDVDYKQVSVPLAPGDSLTLYTDGISEAMNVARDVYGSKRLEAQLASSVTGVKALGQQILDDVRRFVGSHPQSDDMCVTCFGRVG